MEMQNTKNKMDKLIKVARNFQFNAILIKLELEIKLQKRNNLLNGQSIAK